MKQYLNLLSEVMIAGDDRQTRSGAVRSLFNANLKFDLRAGFPAVTTKKLAFKSMVGELLWFMSDNTDLPSLRRFSDKPKDAWTIWTPDYERWARGLDLKEDLGKLYGHQWRNFAGHVDQITALIYNLKTDPNSRYLYVTALNPSDTANNAMALNACHTYFQCYVTADGYLDLDYTQRSVDCFLGLPFNLSSYAMLMHILCEITGLKPRYLYASLKDVHIYHEHFYAVEEQLGREPTELPDVVLPKFDDLAGLLTYTAKDFSLVNYKPQGAIKAPLSVGK